MKILRNNYNRQELINKKSTEFLLAWALKILLRVRIANPIGFKIIKT